MLVADPKVQCKIQDVPQTAWHLEKIKIQNTSCAHLVILAWTPAAANIQMHSPYSLICYIF